MPTYQYACTDPECGNRFELVQSFTDPSATQCPVCQGAVRKVYGSVGVVFKGSGFYRNDSRSTSTSAESGESGASGASGASSEGKAEKKSDSGTKSESTTSKAGAGSSASSSSSSSGSAAKSASPA